MSTLQVRDVPEDVKRVLKSRAAAAGQSLSEYVLAELTRAARRPTLAELVERIQQRGGPMTDLPPAADVLRAERELR